MLKTLTTIAALLAAFAASAQTIPLLPTGCDASRMCSNVDQAGTRLQANPSLMELTQADGTVYLGFGVVGMSVVNFPAYRQPGNDKVILVTASWETWWTKGSGSGRGGYQRHQHWALTGGELTY